jgi:predicted ATPase/DNA-binding CsgD family transcriptional regulator
MAPRESNLPAARGRLIGRDRELAAVAELALHADGRLVTLTGTGGIGKTSLAFEAARRLRTRFPDGAMVVRLERAGEADDIALRTSQALGLAEEGWTAEAAVADFLETRQALLLIDDCDEATATTAAFVDHLLDRCPDLRILVTCRTRLHVRGEAVFVVPPIAVPTTDRPTIASLAGVPSVELFVERARAARPGFALRANDAEGIAAVCRRLDGIPLAIELAAAQAAVLSPAEIAERLPGQESLHASIESSLRLLPEDATRLFRRLAVFEGGWTLPAAEGVCSLGGDRGSIAEGLAMLVERSLVLRDETADGRFLMLAPIAEHAATLLAAFGETDAVGVAHAQYYLGLITGRVEGWRPEAFELFRTIDAEYENVGAAIRFGERTGAAPLVVGLNLALLGFWGWRGWLRAAIRNLGSALVMVGEEPSRGRAHVLGGLAHYGRMTGDLDAAEAWALEQERVAEAVGDALALGSGWSIRSTIALDRGETDLALALSSRVRTYLGDAPAPLAIGLWHANRARIHRRRGEQEATREHLEAARHHLEEADSWFLAPVVVDLGEQAMQDGRIDDADTLMKRALGEARRFDARLFIITAVRGIGRVALERRAFRRAATLQSAATALDAEAGRHMTPDDQRRATRDLERLRAALPEAAFEEAWRRGIPLSVHDAAQLAASDGEPAGGPVRAPIDPLTPREREIAVLLAEGLTNPQIAERLAISSGTVRTHVERILGKLGATSRVQIATWVARDGASVT